MNIGKIDSQTAAAGQTFVNKYFSVLTSLWTLAKEHVLSPGHSFIFLGIDLEQRANGDVYLSQKAFTTSLLEKRNMHGCQTDGCQVRQAIALTSGKHIAPNQCEGKNATTNTTGTLLMACYRSTNPSLFFVVGN